jgi:hypothetical protein
MSEQLYLCVHAAEFPAQALLRLRPEMQSQPVAVLEGRAPLEAICALNRHAERRGVVCGMTRLEAEAIAGLAAAVAIDGKRGSGTRGGAGVRCVLFSAHRGGELWNRVFLRAGYCWDWKAVWAAGEVGGKVAGCAGYSGVSRVDCGQRQLSYRTVEGSELTRRNRDS